MIHAVIPKLPFIDKQKTIDFYVRLGFTVQSDYGDYLILTDPGAELHFFAHSKLQPDKSDFMIYVRVEDIDRLYKTVQSKGIEIHPNGALEDKSWNQREFALLDPNGTLLTFGQSLI